MSENKLDLIVSFLAKPDEKTNCILLRDVKRGETICYTNIPVCKTEKLIRAEVLKDLHKGAKLIAGVHSKGEIVIQADVGTENWLCVRLVEEEQVTVKSIEDITKFDVFEDTVKSIMERWRKFVDKNPKLNNIESVGIKGFMGEINDVYSKYLMELGETDE